jgi:acetoin utilization protein AcuB
MIAKHEESLSPRTSIVRFMTRGPRCIERHKSLSEAHDLMRALRIRHLPVVDQGRIVGVLSERDLFFTESLRDVDPATVPVEEAMSPDPYVVSPEQPLGKVVGAMAERKYGSAVVVRDEEVIGIFTTTDALRAVSLVSETWR